MARIVRRCAELYAPFQDKLHHIEVPLGTSSFGRRPVRFFDAVRYIPHWRRQIKGGPAATAAELQRFYVTLFAAYAEEIGGNVVFRMKEWWFYVKCAFADPATVHKLVRKTKKVD